MTLKTDYVLLCENLLNDDTGKVTIVNAFDTIYTDQLPAMQAALFFVAQILVNDANKKDEDDDDLELKVINPSNDVILSVNAKLNIKSSEHIRKNIIGAQLNGMPITEYGVYKFVLLHHTKKIAQRDLTVVKGNREDAVKNH